MKYCDQCRSTFPNEFNVCPIDNAALRVTSELIPGMTIRDKYLILDKVGEGGMGVVYRARHLAFNEIRALKVVHQSFAEDKAFIKRFKTEAIVARKLLHPNAVRIDDLDSTEDGRPFIVMELVEGGSLKTLIAENGILPVNRALDIAAQAADALAAAHRMGIVHRDIKPDNILVTRSPADGRSDLVKVVDFGIAKVREGTLDVGSGYGNTRSGMIVGTPQYLSPEQAMGKQGDQIDGRADIYSLGIVLYVMLTGQLPFDSDTPMGFLLHHVQTHPVAPHVIRPDLKIPAVVEAVLMKALEKDRDKRFASADEMAQALRQLRLATPPVTYRPPAPDLPTLDLERKDFGYRQPPETPHPSPKPMRAPEPIAAPARVPAREPVAAPAPVRAPEPVAAPAPVRTPDLARAADPIRSENPVRARGPLYAPDPMHASLPEPARKHWLDEPPPAAPKRTGLKAAIWVAASVIALGAILAVVYASGAFGGGSKPNVTPPKVETGTQVPTAHDTGDSGVSREVPSSASPAGATAAVTPVKPPPTPATVIAKPPLKKQTPQSNAPATEPPAKAKGPDVDELVSSAKRAAENGEYDSAISTYRKVLKDDPNNTAAQDGLNKAERAKKAEQTTLTQH